jgi:hypothetical protein
MREGRWLIRDLVELPQPVLNRQYELSVPLGLMASMGHEGWSWHLALAQDGHAAMREESPVLSTMQTQLG